MPRTLLNTLVAIVVLAATHAEALGLGDITLESALNQPLAARIQLVDTGGISPEEISVSIASAQDFDRFSLQRPYFLDNIRLVVESNGNGHFIRVSSSDPVREPYLAFVLDTRWPSGRMLTEYTVLLDPPAFASQPVRQQPQPPVRTVSEAVSAPTQAEPAPEAPVAPEPPAEPEPSATADAPAVAEAPATPEPSAEPEPAADTPAPRQTFADTSGPDTVTVGDTDTLWEIALRVRPDSSVSVQQTMLALQRANPDAFISDNINLVRRGEVLRIPDASEMRNLGSAEAIAEVGRQNQLFASRQGAPAASQPLAAPPAGTAATADTQGELRVVTADDTTDEAAAAATAAAADSAELDSEIASMEDRLAVSREELDRVDRENAELTERLAMLQEQISSAQELLRLRDLELAQLQESLAAETGDSPATEAPAPTTVTMAPEAGPVERLLNQVLNNPIMLGLMLALLVALIVLLLLRRNKAKQAALADEHEDEEVTDFTARDEDRAAFAAAGLAGSAAMSADDSAEDSPDLTDDLTDDLGEDLDELYEIGETVAGGDPEPEQDSVGEPESAFDVSWDDGDQDERSTSLADTEIEELHREQTAELLAEVDALIAHEEYQEAQGVLQDAIVADPNNAVLRVKLLEVCVAEDDETAFRLQESELSRLPLSAADRKTIDDLRTKLSGGESDEPQARPKPDDKSNDNNSMGELDDMELELDMEASSEVDDSKVLAGSKPAQPEDDDNSELSEGQQEDDSSDEDDNEIDFDFDLDLDLDEELDSDDDSLLEEEDKAENPQEGDDDDPFGLSELTETENEAEKETEQNIDVNMDAEESSEEGSEESSEQDDSDFSFDIDDFDLNLEDDNEPEQGRTPEAEAGTEAGEQDIEFTAPDDEAPSEPEPEHKTDALEGLEFTSTSSEDAAIAAGDAEDDDDFQFLSDSDEAGTKLDLARAYIDMDDIEGAREILEEVIEEGAEAQVEQARQLLGRLG